MGLWATLIFCGVVVCYAVPAIIEHVETPEEYVARNDLKSVTDAFKTVEELVKERGFTYIPIDVTTADGYICTMFRVLDPKVVTATKEAVILQHGILDSSDTWVLDEIEDSFAFLLAQQGYDVYMTNNRGNKHCKRHSSLTTDHDDFWRFSWDEMAKYDVPAFVNKVLEISGRSKLVYIAHSQGTTQMFAAMTSQPDLPDKIQDFVALAPVAFLRHSTCSMLHELSSFRMDAIVTRFGRREFLPSTSLFRYAFPRLCDSWATGWMCEWGMWMVTGYSWTEINRDRLPVYMAHFPSGTSIMNGVHWAQTLRSPYPHEFRRLDYDDVSLDHRTNADVYGTHTPPEYTIDVFPLNKTELTLFSGEMDPLANSEDVKRLVEDLPGQVSWTTFKEYDHMTFLWGKNAARDIYHPVMEHLDMKRINKASESPLRAPEKYNREKGTTHIALYSSAFALVAVFALGLAVAGTLIYMRSRQRSRTVSLDVYQAVRS